MTRAALGLLVLVAACAAPPPPSGVPAPIPVVSLVPGRADTVDASRYGDVAFDPPPEVGLEALGDGRAVIRAEPAFRGLVLVPFEAGPEPHAVAVEAPAPGPGALRLDLVGVRREDASVIDLDLRQLGEAGLSVPLTVDEDTGIVVLVGDRVPSDNAVDLDLEAGRLGIDLDAAGPGAHRLRVAARAGGLVSNWVGVDVRDGRLVR